MNIGDRVRLLRGTEEGRIVSFKGKDIVEIEIEDGFTIPALKTEVVVVSQSEGEFFNRGRETESKPQETKPEQKSSKTSLKGLFISFVPLNDNDHTLNLMNLTEKSLLYNFCEMNGLNHKSLAHGSVSPNHTTKITELKLTDFEKWPAFLLQTIKINDQFDTYQPLQETNIKLKASSFFKSKTIIPGIEKEGYMISVDNKMNINPEALKESFHRQKDDPTFKFKDQTIGKSGKTKVVDLHIEELTDNYQNLSKEDILSMQLKKFEYELDSALISGYDNIKFIHGIGNGTLRLIIHKALSKSEHIKYFEDADKGRFGFSATMVHL